MQTEKQDIEQLLLEGHSVQIHPQGYSMYPILVPDRDAAVIMPFTSQRLKRGDVVLYRRDTSDVIGEQGILVLHRIWKVHAGDIYMVGDNQKEIEGPLRIDQIRGIMTELVRKGRNISVKNPIYRILTGVWLWLRPFRPAISHTVAAVKNRFRVDR